VPGRDAESERLARELAAYRVRDPEAVLRERVLRAARETAALAAAPGPWRRFVQRGWAWDAALGAAVLVALAANVFLFSGDTEAATATDDAAVVANRAACDELGLHAEEWTCRRLSMAERVVVVGPSIRRGINLLPQAGGMP